MLLGVEPVARAHEGHQGVGQSASPGVTARWGAALPWRGGSSGGGTAPTEKFTQFSLSCFLVVRRRGRIDMESDSLQSKSQPGEKPLLVGRRRPRRGLALLK